jgi:hypothetical protein
MPHCASTAYVLQCMRGRMMTGITPEFWAPLRLVQSN